MVAASIYDVSPDGVLDVRFHAGQAKAFRSTARFVLVLAGSQSGKTTVGPPWLFREMQAKGPGDYLVVSPTFSLMEIKVIPEFKRFFQHVMGLGDYVSSPVRKFTLSPQGNRRVFGKGNPDIDTHVYFGYGNDPDSLESATYKAAWLDEAGQRKFKLASWEAILRRLSIAQGRVLLTTTPYTLGWLKKELHDRASDPTADVDVINFTSSDNPVFPIEEWERARKEMPRWKFNMFYRGQFDRPAGLIYDCFEESLNTIPRFPIPDQWPRFMGIDFGGTNTAAVLLAQEVANGKPVKRYYAYREYHAGGRTAQQHVERLLSGELGIPKAVGGSKSEGQWRDEFRQARLPIAAPKISDVEVGINRVYGGIAQREIVFFDDLDGTLEQIETYSRKLDESGEPTEGIEDKETFHYLDALRYIMSYLRASHGGGLI